MTQEKGKRSIVEGQEMRVVTRLVHVKGNTPLKLTLRGLGERAEVVLDADEAVGPVRAQPSDTAERIVKHQLRVGGTVIVID